MASPKIINMKRLQYSKRHRFSRNSSAADFDTDYDFAGMAKFNLTYSVGE